MKIPKKMKAAVLYGPDDIRIVDADVPEPGRDEVLIKVAACAICGSDLSMIHQPWPLQPRSGEFIPGHEYSGTVAATGEGVDEFRKGDRVAVEVHKGCGKCVNCRRGEYTSCLNYGYVDRGHRANGFTSNGGYAQYVVNHVSTVYGIPEKISFEEACLVTTAGCPLYGIELAGGYIVGDTVVVAGPGPTGLMAVQIANALGAGRVILTGTRESRLQVGKKLGADHIININKDDPVKAVASLTGGRMADLVIECSGSEAGLQSAVEIVRRGGRILLIGFPHQRVPLDLDRLIKDNVNIYTVRGEGRANCARALSLMEKGKIRADKLITHTFPLGRIHEALETFRNRTGGAIKVILKP